jgi:taurine--2-oxoglutarate transaminase
MARSPKEILDENLDYSYFSWSKQNKCAPLNIARAEGVFLYDQDGKSYIDFSSQVVNVNIGHNDQRVKEAIKKQMDELIYVCTPLATEVRGRLAKKLAEIAPGDLTKTFFTNGGSDAIESGIKLARLVTGRHKILTRYRSYHGSSYGAFSASGDPRKFQVDRQAMPGIVHVEDPYCYRCPWKQKPESCLYECVEHFERVIEFEGPDQIAAILMEGESAPASMCIQYPPEYWKKIKEIADKHGILILVDEVLSAFGRVGQWFGIQNHGIEPDMIAMGKGLTSGYMPMGALITSEKIARFFEDNMLRLGSTTAAHSLACAAALANIEIYEVDNLFENSMAMGAYVKEKCEALKSKHPVIGDVRMKGLLGGIELIKDPETKEPLVPWNANPEEYKITSQLAARLKELGMFTFVRWNWIYITPPLIITKEEIDLGIDIIDQALGEL